MLTLIKLSVSAALIWGITVLSKRSVLLGGVLASLPLVSMISILWIYQESGDTQTIIALCHSIVWLVLGSIPFFIVLPWCLQKQWPFTTAFGTACLACVLSYGALMTLVSQLKLIR